jgi:uncharacterized membrane protein
MSQKSQVDWEAFHRKQAQQVIWQERKQKLKHIAALLFGIAMVFACYYLWVALLPQI